MLTKGKMVLWTRSPQQNALLNAVYGAGTSTKFQNLQKETLIHEEKHKNVILVYAAPTALSVINQLTLDGVTLTTPVGSSLDVLTAEIRGLVNTKITREFQNIIDGRNARNAEIDRADRSGNRDSRYVRAACTACGVALTFPECTGIPPY